MKLDTLNSDRFKEGRGAFTKSNSFSYVLSSETRLTPMVVCEMGVN